MPIDRSNMRGLVRAIAYDRNGARLGRVAQVFLDDRSDDPAWVAVDVTRVRGMRLLPLAGAALKGRHLVIRAERPTVRSAPRIDLGDGQLSSQDEARLLEHYGLASDDQNAPITAEHRPASPWPDDTDRETAWESQAPRQPNSQDTQAMPVVAAPLGAVPGAAGREQQPAAGGEIGDRATMRRGDADVPPPPPPNPFQKPSPTPSQSQPQGPPPTPSQSQPQGPPPTPSQSQPPPTPSPAPSAETTAAIPVQRPEPASVPEPRPDGDTTAR